MWTPYRIGGSMRLIETTYATVEIVTSALGSQTQSSFDDVLFAPGHVQKIDAKAQNIDAAKNSLARGRRK